MRAVLDTNVIVSGLLFGGVPREVLECAQRGVFTMVVSREILAEYTEVVNRVAGQYRVSRAQGVLDALVGVSELALSVDLKQQVCPDPKDDKFFAAAHAANVTTIVSGDKHLKAASGWRGIGVLSPATFLRALHRAER